MTTLTVPGTVTTRRSSRRTWAILELVLLVDALDVPITTITATTIPCELREGRQTSEATRRVSHD